MQRVRALFPSESQMWGPDQEAVCSSSEHTGRFVRALHLYEDTVYMTKKVMCERACPAGRTEIILCGAAFAPSFAHSTVCKKDSVLSGELLIFSFCAKSFILS